MAKRILLYGIGAAVVGAIGFFALAWRSPIAPVSPPPSFPQEKIARGAVIAGEGYCVECHTAKDGGAPYAGGYAMKTPFGTIFSSNITPDVDTGIGSWSEEAFRRAMREGVGRKGEYLLPAFPYTNFTRMSDEDISDLYAFFMSMPAVKQRKPDNTIPFPLNIRMLLAGWNFLFFDQKRFEPNPAKSDEWNRGYYLASGVSHCDACHTPRNLLMGLKKSELYQGMVIDGWDAPALTAANRAPMPFTADEFYSYLRRGTSRYHGVSAGPMASVTNLGYVVAPDSDIRALAAYFSDMSQDRIEKTDVKPIIEAAAKAEAADLAQTHNADARLYNVACGACHYNGAEVNPLRPSLSLSDKLTAENPRNIIQAVLHGVGALDAGARGPAMPAYGAALSDEDIARILSYLRATRTNAPPWRNLEKQIAELRSAEKE